MFVGVRRAKENAGIVIFDEKENALEMLKTE
jgi:hypothetical protein